MDKFGGIFAEKIGDAVEGLVCKALGVKEKDDEKDDKKSNILSFFGGNDKEEEKDKDKDKDNGGFSFGGKSKEEEKGGFFSNIFDKDDNKEKPSGFHGLFNQQEGASGGCEEPNMGGYPGPGSQGQSIGVNDGDLLSDLMDVADETSKGK